MTRERSDRDAREQAEGLEAFRQRIDALDELLVRTIAERLGICADVARFKRARGIPMMQPHRIDEVKERAAIGGAAAGLSPAFVYELYALIIAEACRIEEELIGAADPGRP